MQEAPWVLTEYCLLLNNKLLDDMVWATPVGWGLFY